MGEGLTVHASTVAVQDRALLILGPSGCGKSALALTLMAHGAGLIADDRTILTREGESLLAACPPAIRGRIEARGMGLLAAVPHATCRVALAIDLGQRETERLPPRREVSFLGLSLPLLHDPGTGHVAPALLQYLRQGRTD